MVKPTDNPPLAGGQAQAEGYVSLSGAAVAHGDDVLTAQGVLAAGQFHHQCLVHRGYGQGVEGVQALDGGETSRADPPFHHALVAVDQFQFSQAQQVLGMVYIFGGSLGGQLTVFPEKAGQPELLKVVLQEQSGLAAHAALLERRLM